MSYDDWKAREPYAHGETDVIDEPEPDFPDVISWWFTPETKRGDQITIETSVGTAVYGCEDWDIDDNGRARPEWVHVRGPILHADDLSDLEGEVSSADAGYAKFGAPRYRKEPK